MSAQTMIQLFLVGILTQYATTRYSHPETKHLQTSFQAYSLLLWSEPEKCKQTTLVKTRNSSGYGRGYGRHQLIMQAILLTDRDCVTLTMNFTVAAITYNILFGAQLLHLKGEGNFWNNLSWFNCGLVALPYFRNTFVKKPIMPPK